MAAKKNHKHVLNIHNSRKMWCHRPLAQERWQQVAISGSPISWALLTAASCWLASDGPVTKTKLSNLFDKVFLNDEKYL